MPLPIPETWQPWITLIKSIFEVTALFFGCGWTFFKWIANPRRQIISPEQETTDSRTPLISSDGSFDFAYGLDASQIDEEYRYADNVPRNPPRLTLNYNSQTTSEGQLKRALLAETDSNVVEVFADGMGGIGKTCALRGLATDADIRKRFKDGLLFIQLGNDATKATTMRGIRKIVHETGGIRLANYLGTTKSLQVVVKRASEWFQSRSCLFLVDDVWRKNGISSSGLEALSNIAKGRSRMVYTTRDRQLAIAGQQKITFGPRNDELSRLILMNHSFQKDSCLSQQNEEALHNILRICAGHPLALSVAGGVVRKMADEYVDNRHNALQDVSRQLSGNSFPEAELHRNGQLAQVVDVSLTSIRVEGHQSCDELLAKLCLLQKQDEPPISMLQRLWGMDDLRATENMAELFRNRSLIEIRRFDNRVTFTVHDLIMDIATKKAGAEQKQFARALLDSYMPRNWFGPREWWLCEGDRYIHENLCRLLAVGDYKKELLWLLSKPEWVIMRLREGGASTVENDMRRGMPFVGSKDSSIGTHVRHLQVMIEAAHMAHLYVWSNKYEAWFQMYGRLLSYAKACKRTERFVQEIEVKAPRPWAKASLGLLDAAGGALRHLLRTDKGIHHVAFGDNHAHILTTSAVSTINILNGNIDRKMLRIFADDVECIVISIDGKQVVTGHKDATIRVWDVNSGQVVKGSLRGHKDKVLCVAISADGKRVVTGHKDGTIQVWDVDGGQIVNAPLTGHTDRVWCVAISADGRLVVSGSSDRTVRVWDVGSGKIVSAPLRGHRFTVTCVDISSDGRRVVAGSSDGTVRVWDVDSGQAVSVLMRSDLSALKCVAISANGGRVASESYNNTVQVWDVDSGQIVSAPLRGHTGAVTYVGISADGRQVISGSDDRTVRVWDVDGGQIANAPLTGHTGRVLCVSVSPDGRRAVSGSSDTTVRVWDVNSGQIINAPLRGHTNWVRCVAISADGKQVVSGSDDMTVRVWNVDSGQAVNVPLRGHRHYVKCVAISNDGRRIVSGSSDMTVRVWNIADGDIVGTPLLHEEEVSQVAVDENGMIVVSKEVFSGIQRLWDVLSGKCICTSEESTWQSKVDSLSLTWSSNYPETRVLQWTSSDGQLNLATLQSKGFRFGRKMFSNKFSGHCEVVDS